MKKIAFILIILSLASLLLACEGSGEIQIVTDGNKVNTSSNNSYTYMCKDCGTKTSTAYYDYDVDITKVMCEECARKYWMPLDYRTYIVSEAPPVYDVDVNANNTKDGKIHISAITSKYSIEDYRDGKILLYVNGKNGWVVTDTEGYVIYSEKLNVKNLFDMNFAEDNIVRYSILAGGIHYANIETNEIIPEAEYLPEDSLFESENGLTWKTSTNKTLNSIEYVLTCYDENDNVVWTNTYDKSWKKSIPVNKTGAIIIYRNSSAEVIVPNVQYSSEFVSYNNSVKTYLNSLSYDDAENILEIKGDFVKMFGRYVNEDYFYNLDTKKYIKFEDIKELEGASKFKTAGCSEGLFAVDMASQYGGFSAVVDSNGNIVCQPTNSFSFNDYGESYFSDGLCVACDPNNSTVGNSKWGYINKNGEWAIQPEFGNAKPFDGGYALALYKNSEGYNKWGLIDTAGNFVFK